MLLKLKKKPLKVSLREFYDRRNKILLIRDARGIGDILTCRMLFKTFKEVMPDCHLTFACWKEYHDLVQNHPYLDEVIDSRELQKESFPISYDISVTCVYYESIKGTKNDKHRADIWAEHCGLNITDHNMYLPFMDDEYLTHGYLGLKELRQTSMSKYNKDGPSVLFTPFSFETMRSLTDEQIIATVQLLRDKGLFVYSAHSQSAFVLAKLSVPVIIARNLKEWAGYIHAADYVISVDTSNFHYAGGIKKPLMGIFTHVDGKLRGKYFDFILVQKHRDDGNWPCGPCYNYITCNNPRCKDQESLRPCLTEITPAEIEEGLSKMLQKWNI